MHSGGNKMKAKNRKTVALLVLLALGFYGAFILTNALGN